MDFNQSIKLIDWRFEMIDLAEFFVQPNNENGHLQSKIQHVNQYFPKIFYLEHQQIEIRCSPQTIIAFKDFSASASTSKNPFKLSS